MEATGIELLASVLFGLAILHTFSVKRFEHIAHHYAEGSVSENFFHILGEVEVVFGLWAAVLMIGMVIMSGSHHAVEFLEARNYTEPMFVFAIMTVAATRPVLKLAEGLIARVAHLLPMSDSVSFFLVALIVGPLLGSFITEPAAMTVTALILKERFYDRGLSNRFMYSTIGVLFVNISIGGTLTHFAAPPVLMVAGKWNWDMAHMLLHFGWKSAIAVVINTIALTVLNAKELKASGELEAAAKAKAIADNPNYGNEDHTQMPVPWWLILVHVVFLGLVVINAHHMVVFMGIFLFFLGVTAVTEEYQEPLKLKEGLLVGFFLAGLVTLGALQRWWLEPLISGMSDVPLFLGATGLTAITDNAALTFLGSLVEGISDNSKYALVAGAVAGGGLTVIANAPNPAGYGILKESFGDEGISPILLFASAFGPTVVAMLCLWFLPNFGA